jgi:hypothetical protein
LNSNSFSESNITKKDVYDVVIDRHIIGILTNFEKSSGQLKESLENIIKRRISSHTFSIHISNLIVNKLIQKSDLGRGKTISYSLTDSARKKIDLGLLGNEEERIKQLKRVYNAVLFYHILYYVPKILFSDEEFRQVLVKLGVNENELNWCFMSFGDDDSPFIVYGRDKRFSMGRQPHSVYKEIVAEYWRDRPELSTVLAEIKFVCYPAKGNLEIYIERIEYWQINKNSSNMRYLTEYHFHLCGFSVSDIVSITGEEYNIVDKLFANLKKLNLIRPITSISGEPKFRFKDKEIEDLFAAIWEVHAMGEFWLLMKKWSYFDKPTEEELIRLETLLGKVESERIKKLCDRTRSKTIVALKKSKTIYEFIRYLVENREITFLDVPPTISNGYNEYALYLKENDPDKYKKEIPSRTKVLCAKYDPFFNRALERLENKTTYHSIVTKR